jgi:protein ImuA
MPPPTAPRPLDALTQSLGQIAPTWRGQHQGRAQVQPTGFSALNELLPGGGWPLGALTELIPAENGIGEVRLLLPAVRQMCRAQRRVVFIDPPFTPNPPALHERGLPLDLALWIAAKSDEDGVWAACQLLREASTGAVLLWSGCTRNRTLRKLQLAAETGHSLAFAFRGIEVLRQASPAALRAELRPANGTLVIHVHKARGGRPGTAAITLPKIRL